MIPKHCETCQKWYTQDNDIKCHALKTIGAWGENCTAWTNDSQWQEKIKQSEKVYAEKRK